jgi:hypothetical protein
LLLPNKRQLSWLYFLEIDSTCIHLERVQRWLKFFEFELNNLI